MEGNPPETGRASGQACGLTAGPEGVLAAFKAIPGVLDAFYPDRGYLQSIRREEEGILATGGMRTRNDGLINVMGRRHVIIAVTSPGDMDFDVDEPTVELRTQEGRLMGTNVTESTKPAYMDRPNSIWLSDDFILFTDVKGDGREAFVMPAVNFPHLNGSHGCRNAICCFPATTNSHRIMRDRGFCPSHKLATMIVGFDLCDRTCRAVTSFRSKKM